MRQFHCLFQSSPAFSLNIQKPVKSNPEGVFVLVPHIWNVLLFFKKFHVNKSDNILLQHQVHTGYSKPTGTQTSRRTSLKNEFS